MRDIIGMMQRVVIFVGGGAVWLATPQTVQARETLSIANAQAAGHRVSLAVGADLGFHQRMPAQADVSTASQNLRTSLPNGLRAGFGVALGIGSKSGGPIGGLFAVDYASTLRLQLRQAASDGTSVNRPARYQDATLRAGMTATRVGRKLILVGGLGGGLRLSSYFSPVHTAYVNHLRVGPAAIATLGFANIERRFFLQAKPEIAYLLPGADLKAAAGAKPRLEGGARVDLGVRLWRGYFISAFGEYWATASGGSPSRTIGLSLNHFIGR